MKAQGMKYERRGGPQKLFSWSELYLLEKLLGLTVWPTIMYT